MKICETTNVNNYITLMVLIKETSPVTLGTLTATVTLNPNGGTMSDGTTTSTSTTYSLGTSVSSVVPTTAPTCNNAIFKGWTYDYNGSPLLTTDSTAITKINSDITLCASWAGIIPYTVQYYTQVVNGTTADSDYTLAATENLSGFTGDTPTYSQKTFAGFERYSTKDVIPSIASDGSTVVKIYYNRKSVIVTLSSGTESFASSYTTTYSGTYGATFTAPSNPTSQSGVKFDHWSPSLPSTFPEENTTYTAKWLMPPSILVSVPTSSGKTLEITMTSDDTTYTFSATSGFNTYSWTYTSDSSIWNSSSTSFSIEKSATAIFSSLNILLVVTDSDGKLYSAQYTVALN